MHVNYMGGWLKKYKDFATTIWYALKHILGVQWNTSYLCIPKYTPNL